jgi:hypothetical protein
MRVQRLAALVLFVAGLAACSDQPTPDPTAPDVKVLFAAGGPNAPCGSALGKTVADQQVALYSGATLTQIQDAWTPVVRDCKNNLPTAQAEMLSYVQLTINKAAIYLTGGANNALTVAHWNSVFAYVNVFAPNLDTTVLSLKGGAAVVVNPLAGDSAEVRTVGPYAGIKIYHQDSTGDPRTHLITINPNPRPGTCITGTNLTQHGPCFEFSANPHLTKWDPRVVLGICQDTTTLPFSVPGAIIAALGHQPTLTGAATIIAYRTYPQFCGHEPGFEVGSWTGGFRGIKTRLAYLLNKAFAPERAYAGHSGIGGTGGGISPFAGVDRKIFYATSSSSALNLPPDSLSPERGKWTTIFAKSPGTILVQNGLGDLTGKVIVLSQAGGNCDKKCGGLELTGTVTSANSLTASTGVYDILFDAVNDAPTVKKAPIVLQSTTGDSLAVITFATKSNQNQIFFNKDLTPVANWVQHVHQNFHLVVDFFTTPTAPTVSLTIISPLPGGGSDTTEVPGRPFLDGAAATNIGAISAKFTGIDSGIFGWDNISIERRPDEQ